MGRPYRYFKQLNYPDVRSILQHASQISESIMEKQAKQEKQTTPVQTFPLSNFDKQVLELAPRFLRGQYQVRQIAEEILRRKGVKPTQEEKRATRKRVQRVLAKLQRRVLIFQTSASDRLRSRVKLREAFPQEAEKHVAIIHRILKTGHRFLLRDWRKHLSFKDALDIGKGAITIALETHDPKKGKFFTHAAIVIASEISQEVRKRRRFVSLDRPTASERTLHEKIGQPAFEPELLEEHLQNLFRHPKVSKPQLVVWTLRRIFGHNFPEIADHFGCTYQNISTHSLKVEKILRGMREK